MKDRLQIDVKKSSKEELTSKFGLEKYIDTEDIPFLKRIQPVIWQLFEEPRSSKPATVNLNFFLQLIFAINYN